MIITEKGSPINVLMLALLSFYLGCASETEVHIPHGQTIMDLGSGDPSELAHDQAIDPAQPEEVAFDTEGIDEASDPSPQFDSSEDPASDPELDQVEQDLAIDMGSDLEEEEPPPLDCGFTYDEQFAIDKAAWSAFLRSLSEAEASDGSSGGERFEREPPPPYLYSLPAAYPFNLINLVMPGYHDDMPLFERGRAWDTERRCYEIPSGAVLYTQDEAYELYRSIAELTTGVAVDTTPGARSVVGLRGAYPGTFEWHGNFPDRFNDTLVLLWIDGSGTRHVREFAAHTDVGAYNFGVNSSSSLRPNRRYRYINHWHSDYNALRINEARYWVRDDTNNNGHWDSDRNGWLPPYTGNDYDRVGSGHNIHMARAYAPLGQAPVGVWSAGCQVIPGRASWIEFITHAWTGLSDPVDYFLIDTRDIPMDVWEECTPDGTVECPYPIQSDYFVFEGDTSLVETRVFDIYNCSTADESGPEVVFVFTVDREVTVDVQVECEDPLVDIDVHLLEGADANACIQRAHWGFSAVITPGRYWIVADTWVNAEGVELSGPFRLTVSFD